MVFTLGPQISTSKPTTQTQSPTRYQAPMASSLVGSFVNQDLGELTAQAPKTQVSRSAEYGIGRNTNQVALDGNNPIAQSSRRQAQGALDWQKRMKAMEATRLANQNKQRATSGARQPSMAGQYASAAQIPAGTSGGRAKAIQLASGYLGTPYVLGGNSKGGIDCSGLVQQVYRQLGFNPPRLAAQQAAAMPGVRTSINNLRPGDLVAWADGSHIAIYAGGGYVIQALNPRQGTIRSHLSQQTNQNYYGIAVRFPGE